MNVLTINTVCACVFVLFYFILCSFLIFLHSLVTHGWKLKLYIFVGHKGIWVYKVGEIPSSDGHLCDEWYQRNKKLKDVRRKGFAKLPPCPCSKHNIYNGVANQWRYFRNDEDNHLECFILNLATTRRYAPFSKVCKTKTKNQPRDTTFAYC